MSSYLNPQNPNSHLLTGYLGCLWYGTVMFSEKSKDWNRKGFEGTGISAPWFTISVNLSIMFRKVHEFWKMRVTPKICVHIRTLWIESTFWHPGYFESGDLPPVFTARLYKFYAMSNDHSSIFVRVIQKSSRFHNCILGLGRKTGKNMGLCLKNQVHPPNPISFLPKCHNFHWVFFGGFLLWG